jgi:hypothetical protein
MLVMLSAFRADRRSTPQKRFYFCRSYSFLTEASKPQGLMRTEGLGTLTKIMKLIVSRTHDFPVCAVITYATECPRSQKSVKVNFTDLNLQFTSVRDLDNNRTNSGFMQTRSNCSWRWHINTIYWPFGRYSLPCLYLKCRFGDWTLPPSTGAY